MQLTLDLDSTFDYPPIAVPLYWLSNWRWYMVWRWDRDRQLERHTRLVRHYFPNGISQADFMEVRKAKELQKYEKVF